MTRDYGQNDSSRYWDLAEDLCLHIEAVFIYAGQVLSRVGSGVDLAETGIVIGG